MIEILRNGFNSESIMLIIVFLLAILISLSVHEFAHGVIAYSQGDDSAKRLGRLTLNPFAHLDLFGTISFVLFGFGWAKPVPINPLHFREYRKGIFLTSIAGIVANIFLAFFSAGAYVLLSQIVVTSLNSILNFIVTFFSLFFYEVFLINLSLAVFNLIPIAPLDGFNVVSSLTKRGNRFVEFMNRYGTIILLALFITGYFDYALSYIVNLIAVPFLNFWNFVWVF